MVPPDDAPASAALFARAQAVTPGGVNSPVRAFRAVGGVPRFMVRGEGPYLYDADGASTSTWSAPGVRRSSATRTRPSSRRSRRAAVDGLSFGTPTAGEVELAELIVDRVGPVEQVRLVNSGTEATMSAVRLARGVTGRSQGREVRRLLPRARRRAARQRRQRRR